MHSYIKSMLLPSREQQDDGEGSTNEVDESIEVEVDLIASCAPYNSYASHGDIASVVVICSESRSDKNFDADPTLDERDGVCVHSEYVKEECIEDCIADECILEEVHNYVTEVVAMEDKREVDDVVAYINEALDVKEEKECIPEEAQEQDIIDESLEIKEDICSVVEVVKDDEAVTDITSLVKVDQLEDTKAMFTTPPKPRSRVRELMTVWQKSVVDKEKDKECTEAEGVDDDNAVADINEEYIVESVQQEDTNVQSVVLEKKEEKECFQVECISGDGELGNKMKGKQSMTIDCISPMTVDCIAQLENDMIEIIDEKRADNSYLAEQLKLFKAKIVGLEAENRSLVLSSEENAQVVSLLGEEIAEKNVMIDKMSLDIVQLSSKCDDISSTNADLIKVRSAENTDLTEQLRQSKTKNEGLHSEVQNLVKVISMLGEEVAEKNAMIEKMNEDIVQRSTKSDNIISTYADLIKVRSAENADLAEQLRLFKAKNDRLEGEVQTLVANNKENVKQISLLEEELVAAKTMMAEPIAEIYGKNELFEERSAEVADLSERLKVSCAKKIELEADIANLSERLELAMTKINWFEEYVESSSSKIIELEAENQTLLNYKEDIIQEIAVLEDDLTAKMIAIDEMSADIQKKNALLDEKSAEITVLSERLHESTTDKYGLETEIKSLVASNKEHVENISTLNNDLGAKMIVIDEMSEKFQSKIALLEDKSVEIADLMGRFKLSEAKCDEHKVEMERLVAINEENNGKISLLEDENADLTDRLQRSKATNKGLEAEIQAYVTVKKETDQQIAVLEDDLEAKKTVIDEMSAAINQKNALLEEKSAEIADISYRLQIFAAEKHGLKTEVESLVASNDEHVKNTFKLNEDLAAKAIVMDEMNGKIRFKIALLEEKSVEITHLNEQLKLSEAKCVDQRAKMEDLVAMNEKSYGLTFSLENELEVKEMEIADLTEQLQQSQVESDSCHAEMKAFVATSKTNAGLISSLQDELKSKKMNLEDVTNRLLQSQVDVDKLTVKMEGLVAINEKNVGLISLMEDDLKARKLTILDLTKKLQSVEITNIKERLNSTGCPAIPFSQVSSLDNELEAEAMKNEEMTSGIRQTNASLEEKSAEILLLTERLNLAMNENNELKTKVEALVASSKEYVQNISTLKEELETKKIEIHETNTSLVAMHEESAAIAILMEQFQKSNASVEGLKGEMHRLVASNKEYVNKMSLLGDEVMAKQVTIDALNVEIQNIHSTCELTSLLNESKTSNDAMQLDLSKTSRKSKKATTELHGPLLSMPDLLIDEKSNSDKQLQEMVMDKGVEDKVRLYEQALGEANPEILEKKKKYKILSRSLTKPWRKNVNKN